MHNDGPETEIGYRLAWARTYLKGMGLLTNSARGVWV
ncbi:MAG TPA: winged helix-turn-helix domain-containing protein [Streptosporangiaceae bacterium]